MEIAEVKSFTNLLSDLDAFRKLDKSIVLFANERDGAPFDFSSLSAFENIAIVVGAEGGFSTDEKNKLMPISESIGLGDRILRSETASIVLCGIASVMGGN